MASIIRVRTVLLAGLIALAAAWPGLGSAAAASRPAAVRGPEVAYLVLTYDGRVLHLYVNGRLSASAPEAGPPDPGGPNMEIGAYLGSGFWNGAIDELAVYGQSLSPQRIATHYQLGRAHSAQYPGAVQSTPGLVGYWRLDDPGRIVPAVGHETATVPRHGLVGWYGLLTGSHDRAIALNGLSAEIRVRGLPALKSFTIEVWALPGPRLSGTTVVSRPGAWFVKTDLFGHWIGGMVHRRHVEFVRSYLVAVGPPKGLLRGARSESKLRLRAHKPLAAKSSSSSSGALLPAVGVVLLIVLLGVVAASVPGRRRRREPGVDGA